MPLINAPRQRPVAKLHCHSVPVTILARSNLIVRILDTDVTLTRHQLLVIPRNLSYQLKACGGDKARWTTLFIRGTVLRLCDSMDRSAGLPTETAAALFELPYVSRYEANSNYIRYFRRLLRGRSTEQAVMALADFFKELAVSPRQVTTTMLQRGPLSQSTSYLLGSIINHLPHSVNLEDLHVRSGVHSARTISEFRHYTGMTPQQFLRCRRVHLAMYMAAEGTSLKNVAAEFGFANPAHLTSSFYKFFGLAPRSLIAKTRSHRLARHCLAPQQHAGAETELADASAMVGIALPTPAK